MTLFGKGRKVISALNPSLLIEAAKTMTNKKKAESHIDEVGLKYLIALKTSEVVSQAVGES